MNFLLLFLVVFFNNFVFAHENMGRDHGELSAQHNQEAKDFIEEKFKKENLFDSEKITLFIEEMKERRKSILKDTYETKLLEKIELDINSVKTARKKARRKIRDKNSTILNGFDNYLMPKLNLLLTCTHEKRPQNECQDICDDFIRGYNPYYVPNAYRSIWPRDLDLPNNIKRSFIPYKFYQNHQKPEAFNLRVTEENKKTIR